MRVSALPFVLALLLLLACGDDTPPLDPDGGVRLDVTETRPDAPPIAPATECVVTTWREASGARDHREPCSSIEYASTPPVAGPHYSVWADFQTFAEPVPVGYLVHSLEHGAIVLGYDCPGGCPDVLDAFARVVAAHGDDPLCESHDSAASRFIITPMPGVCGLVALAWEHAYQASCIDEPSLTEFVEAHYGRAPEDLCVPGLAETGDWCAG